MSSPDAALRFSTTVRQLRSAYDASAMKLRYRMVPLLILLVSPLLVQAGSSTGSVVGVIHGDTISVLLNGTPTRVRLNGIDCPEARQPFGTRAKQLTAALAFGKTVTVEDKGADRHRRIIADVILPDGTSLNRELVKAGMAWWYRKYAASNWLLKELESDARQARRGLWADTQPVPPWNWRKPPTIKCISEDQ